jgi:hypothetical protein
MARVESMRHILSVFDCPGKEAHGAYVSSDPDVVMCYHRSQISID